MKHTQTILGERDSHDEDPPVNVRQIEKYVEQVLKDPTKVDIETFTLIEQCNNWYREYRRIMEERRQQTP